MDLRVGYPGGAGDGNRTRDSGVAHRRVTSTLRLLGGVSASKTPVVVDRRGRIQLRPATRSSHPLESNQNLSGFSRARRPTTQEWETSVACGTFWTAHARDAQIIIIVLQLSESAALPFPRSGVRSGLWIELNNERAAEVSQGGLQAVTWLRGYRAGPPRRTIRTERRRADQGPLPQGGFGSLIGRTMRIQFQHAGHSFGRVLDGSYG